MFQLISQLFNQCKHLKNHILYSIFNALDIAGRQEGKYSENGG